MTWAEIRMKYLIESGDLSLIMINNFVESEDFKTLLAIVEQKSRQVVKRESKALLQQIEENDRKADQIISEALKFLIEKAFESSKSKEEARNKIAKLKKFTEGNETLKNISNQTYLTELEKLKCRA